MNIQTMSLDEIWRIIEQKAQAHPSYTKGINANCIFQIEGTATNDFSLLINQEGTVIKKGKIPHADCTLVMHEENFKRLIQGKLNTKAAFMTGKLKVKGNLGLALQLEKALKRFMKEE